MPTLLLILIVLLILGGGGGFYYGRGAGWPAWGYGGLPAILVVILLIYLLSGRL